jgi:hypothetical protein
VLSPSEDDLDTRQSVYECCIGLVQCYYEVQDYEKCITASDAAIALGPYIPGCHKLKALSENALGRTNDSIHTMIKACIYEAPWDENN